MKFSSSLVAALGALLSLSAGCKDAVGVPPATVA